MALFGYPNTVGVDPALYLIIRFYNMAVSFFFFFLKNCLCTLQCILDRLWETLVVGHCNAQLPLSLSFSSSSTLQCC